MCHHFLPMMDSTLNEILDFFSSCESFGPKRLVDSFV